MYRFWAKVQKSDGCWEWSGCRNADGYGQIMMPGQRKTGAHRVSFELTNGHIPDGMCVCHRCDNPPCVRPDHLFLGTKKDNHDDAVSKGRRECAVFRGPLNGNSRLSWHEVAHIRAQRAACIDGKATAAMYGVSQTIVSRIGLNKTYRVVV